MSNQTLALVFDWFSLGISLVLIFLLSGFIIQFFLHIFNDKRSIPFLPTKPSIVDKMIKLADLKPGQKVIDLGSGIGSIVTRVARKKQVEVTGVEINYFLHALAVVRSWFIKKKGKVNLKRGDMLKVDLSEYDALLLFVTSDFMNKYLVPKFESELKKDTKIVSFVFRFNSPMFSEKEVEIKNRGFGDKIYVYEKIK